MSALRFKLVWPHEALLGTSDLWLVLLPVFSALSLVLYFRSGSSQLSHIPTVGGPSWPIGSYIGAFRFLINGGKVLQEGYDQYRGRIYKVSSIHGWIVLLTGKTLLNELHSLPDEVASLHDASQQFLQLKYTLGAGVMEDNFQTTILKRKIVGRPLHAILPAVHSEARVALDEALPLTHCWSAVPVKELAKTAVARSITVMLGSRPLARHTRFLDLLTRFTTDSIFSAMIIGIFPTMLKPFVARYIAPLSRTVKRLERILKPELERRRQMMSKANNDDALNQPDDLLSWLMDSVEGNQQYTDLDYVVRMLAVGFGALHTTTHTFAHILYTLAAHPDVAELLREEAEALLDTEMSPAIMSKMVKLDSFLREVNRLHPYPNLSFLRLLRKDHTFGNGTYLPKGTMLAIPVLPHHLDADNYEDAGDFKPFRFTFSATHEAPSAQRRTFTSTDFGYLPFGHGRNACLGRFLVDSIFKAMVCHIVLNYEIRAETTGVRPEDLYLGPVTMPKYSAKVFFRKRQE